MAPKELSISDDRTSAPFNMALFTLEKIHNILKKIAEVSVLIITDSDSAAFSLSPGNSQHMKYRLVRQLFIASIPLLDTKKTSEWQEKTADKLFDIRRSLVYGNKYLNNKIVGRFEAFNEDVEDILDDLVVEIEQKLQKEGYFMPDKRDPRFSWKEA